MSANSSSSSRPNLACEITADRVLAGRAMQPGGPVECAAYSLRPGSVVPDLTETNLRDRDAVSQSIRDAVGSFGGRGRDVIALLPDGVVRVSAAVALSSVVEEYGSAFLEAGYCPGFALPSMLGALGAARDTRPAL